MTFFSALDEECFRKWEEQGIDCLVMQKFASWPAGALHVNVLCTCDDGCRRRTEMTKMIYELNIHPCCWSSTNADLLGLPVAPSMPYFGVCGASGASIPDWGVLGGPSKYWGLPKSVKFNVLAPIEATFSKRIFTPLFTLQCEKIFVSLLIFISFVDKSTRIFLFCLFTEDGFTKTFHLNRTRDPAVLIEPRQIGGKYFFFDFFLISLFLVCGFSCVT